MEKKDYVTLKRILNFHRYYDDYAHQDALEQLAERIEKALVEDANDVPDDVVRLNSKVTVEFINGSRQTFQLLASTKGNTKEGTVSVVSVLGANLVGLAVDDQVKMGNPSDMKSFRIVKVTPSHQLASGLDL